MTILYIGLGMAMISGISAMMQIGRNVNNSMLLSALKQNEYYQSSLPSYDRSIMNILDNYSGPDDEVCSEVKGKINNNQYEDGEIFLTTGTQTPSLHPLFSDSCVLVNKDINHRVLITKDNLGSFNLFSCYLKNESFCTYEINK